MIMMLIAFMFPSGFRDVSGAAETTTTTRPSRAASKAAAAAAAGSGGPFVYNIVLDAGSTGSRIHIFKFKQGSGKQLLLQSDGFHQLKPGLSSFADNPKGAADSLKPLMDEALKAVPAEQQVSLSGCVVGVWRVCDGPAAGRELVCGGGVWGDKGV